MLVAATANNLYLDAQKIKMKEGLIIFIRNPVLGKVKTRLAKTVGDEKAFAIYQHLLAYTHQFTCKINGDKFLYYSDVAEQNDIWENELFTKKVQQGGDLGERMGNAFTELFKAGYHKLIIIGSDCIELDKALIEQAFKLLADHKVVIGPSLDGGYYLLGMTEYIPALFTNKQWGTASVLEHTLHDLHTANINLAQLTALNDIDEEADLPASLKERFDGADWLQKSSYEIFL